MFKSIQYCVVLLLSLCCIQCGKVTNDRAGNSSYNKLIQNNEIRVGYISYPPYYQIAPDGSHSGIFYDVMTEAAKRLGVEINYVKEVTWDGMIQDLKDGNVDMIISGVWPTSQRGKYADFLEPIFFSPIRAYTYMGNTAFDEDLKNANRENVTIACIDGEMSQIIANADFPKTKQLSSPQLSGVSQILLNVSTRKADLTFVEPAVALEFMAKNPNTIVEIHTKKPLRVFPACVMIRKNQEAFKSTLNIVLDELKNEGFIEKVLSKHEIYPASFLRTNTPYEQ